MAEQRVVPMFSCEDVSRAADWIAKAFGNRAAAVPGRGFRGPSLDFATRL
jgi:hypothetical protein